MAKIPFHTVLVFFIFFSVTTGRAQINAIYGGGAIYKDTVSNIDELQQSGFNTLIVWTLHLVENGDINFNFEFDLIQDGEYVGGKTHPNFIDNLKRLKAPASTIKRIEFGIGSWEGQQFEIIKSFYEHDGGFPPSSPIYKNFKRLKETFPMVDAINNDDELTYDLPSAVAFTKMLAELGFKNSIAPYKNNEFWEGLVHNVNSAFPGNMDRNYVQCYAGGAQNSPCMDIWDFGIPVVGGLWGGVEQMSAEEIQSTMQGWKSICANDGGFIWLYDDNVGNITTYARAIEKVYPEEK